MVNYQTWKVTLHKISPNFSVWKVCGKAQVPQSFRRIAQNYAKTVPFHKISTLGNQAKWWNGTVFYAVVKRKKRNSHFVQKQWFADVLQIGALKKFTIFTRRHLCWSLFLIKLQDFRPATLLKKLQDRCFLVNIAKFLRTPFL